MEIMASNSCENMKRAWRRRKYQRLHGASRSKRKVKIPKLMRLKIVSPKKILTKFHDAYVDMMMRLVNTLVKANEGGTGLFRGKKVAKNRHVSVTSGGDRVDTRVVLQIYKSSVASSELTQPFETN